jgi:type II secretory pathway predicted ATPase ExeA
MNQGRLLFTTGATQIIWQALDRCAREKILTVIIANPGFGKTYVTGRWSAANVGKVRHMVVTCTVRNNPAGLVTAICDALGIPGEGDRRLDRACLAVANRLAAEPVMIVIDEADMLTLPSFEKLRGIWDEVSTLCHTDGEHAFPLALCGTKRLRMMLDRDDLERLHSRVGQFEELPAFTQGEMRDIIEKKWPAQRVDDAVLPELHSLSRGSFRWLNRIMPIAAELASKDGKLVNSRILMGVKRHLLGLPKTSKPQGVV